MKKLLLINSIFFSAFCAGQKSTPQFNHCFLVLDSSDYFKLTNSAFIKNEFSGFFTKNNSTNTTSWTGAYLFGDNNYLEIFAPSASNHHVGSSAIALGTDYSGELRNIQKLLNKDYKIQVELRERKVNDSLIPWFQALYIVDSLFFSQSEIEFWIMEYQREYFTYNHWDTNGDSVTRKQYLAQHEEKRKNKYLKRFTGIVFAVNENVVSYYSSLLLKCGFKLAGKNSFISSEGFKINFEFKEPNDTYSIKSIQFATSTPSDRQVLISSHIKVNIHGKEGEIIFH